MRKKRINVVYTSRGGESDVSGNFDLDYDMELTSEKK